MWRAAKAACECNVFATPTGQSEFSDGSPLELGFKFIPSVDGYVSGVRFYKQGAMGGTHQGRLWRTDGSELAQVTFTGETASGWQSATFASPVEVDAGTTYIASYTSNDGRYIATTNYFTSDVVNGPLTAPSSASSGGNGVFSGSAGGFPGSTSSAANYWVDVAFYSDSAPSVVSVSPVNTATSVSAGESVAATFDQAMDPSSFTSSSFIVKDAGNQVVDGTYSYNSTTKTGTYVANEGFATNTTYTATLKGGSGSTVNNIAGVPLASDYSWSFTTEATNACVCSLKDRVNPTNVFTANDGSSVDLGVKIKPSTNGYITAVRFYKPITSSDTTHNAYIWSSSGAQLATVTFTNESEYGWQEAKLSTPLRVYQDTLYIVSYTSPSGTYASTAGAFTGTDISSGYLTAYADQSSENTATGSGTRNGVFTTSAGGYPGSGSTTGNYYWVDAVFSTTSTGNFPLAVDVTQPKDKAVGFQAAQPVTAKFNRSINGATVTNSTVRLYDASNNQVAGAASYDATHGLVTFTPTAPLAANATYTMRLSGSIADNAGATLGAEYSWSFSVGKPISTDPDYAPGGPVLLITNSGDPYSNYYKEILRTEGLTYFNAADLASVDATALASYQVVVLAETSLTQPQADMFTAWVNSGGNLVAMRPDAKLASLLGLTSDASTRANQYMLINTASGPGSGLVSESIQFKGTGDNYSLNGATALANYYSDASTDAGKPAVTTRSVGSNGGTAAAFTYDLAKSVIALHQGSQPWASQDRDGDSKIRSNDLFFGNRTGDVQPDWVDLNKVHIPQADEQQRLLANIIIDAAKDKRPLPRFGYLPGNLKAAIVMAGDDHGLNNAQGSEKVLGTWLNNSPTNCSLADWECVRASHYVYTGSSLTNARAVQFINNGMEVGDHVSEACSNFASYAALNTEYNNDLALWRAKYTGVPNQISHRYHCYIWSDWDSQARVAVNQGIRYDLNYVAYPRTWINDRGAIISGSGMNMRFTDASGELLDVRQGTTNVDDQASNVTAVSLNTLLDSVLTNDYYGIYGTHYDMSNNFDQVLYSAIAARDDVAMISSKQALDWLDGRSSSTFSNFGGADGQFTFDVAAAEGAIGLRAMLPVQDAGGTLSSLSLAGGGVTYQTQSVKGVSYAVFDAKPGTYTATYTDYNPSTGGGGDTGGGTSGGGGGGQGVGQPAGSTGTTTTAGQNDGTDQSASDDTDVTDPDDIDVSDGDDVESPTFPGSVSQNGGAESANESSFPWLWVFGGGGLLLLLIGLIWFIIGRRHNNIQPPIQY